MTPTYDRQAGRWSGPVEYDCRYWFRGDMERRHAVVVASSVKDAVGALGVVRGQVALPIDCHPVVGP